MFRSLGVALFVFVVAHASPACGSLSRNLSQSLWMADGEGWACTTTTKGMLLPVSSSGSHRSVHTATPAEEQPGADAPAEKPLRVLVFSRTEGFRHESIPDGIEAIKALGEENGFEVEATEDPEQFTLRNLRRYSVVVFLSTTGDVLDQHQQLAFEAFIALGGGYVGIHAAADTEYDWPWYGELVGAYFKSHPAVQPADVRVVDHEHPATTHLPEVWRRTDEWYNYRENPRGRVRVLLELDETSYENGGMGSDHPVAWCHEFAGGRAFYTGGGHTSESFAEPEFLTHILGAIRWSAGDEETVPETESVETDPESSVR